MFKYILITICGLSILSAAQGLKCITCTGAKDSDCASKLDAFKTTTDCKTTNDNCYSHQADDGVITRGCLADQSTITAAECTGEKCELCNTADHCNAKIFEATATATTAAAQTTAAQTTAAQTTAAQTTAAATTAAPTTAAAATTPATTAVPTAAPGTVNCISCNSKMDVNCLKKADSFSATACSDNTCYTILWDNFYVRGCLADAVPQVQLICQNKQQTQCKTCTTDKCNVDEVNAAQIQSFATGLLAIVLIVALKNLLHVPNL